MAQDFMGGWSNLAMSTMLSPSMPAQALCPSGPAGDGEQRFLLHGICWSSYIAIGEALLDRPALRLTYDRGALEFMTTSPRHEIYKKWLSRLIEILGEEFNHPQITAGNMTFQKEDLARGLEADDCFWIAHEVPMRGKLTWDSKSDPPPDLAVEIEVSRSALDRIGIYAALGIPEVWCFDGSTLRVLCLQADGGYGPTTQSQFFSSIPAGELARFVTLAETADNLTVVRQFRSWVRQVLGKADA
jgi:Uma2 family endonuclease